MKTILFFFASAMLMVTNVHAENYGTIVIMGDSLASGYGANLASSRPLKYLSDLPHKKVIDISRSGSRSSDTLKQTEKAVELKPDLIFVSSGGNDTIADAMQSGSYKSEKTIKEMTEVFTKLVGTGATVVYLGLDIPIPGAERLTRISKIAKEKGVIVFDGMSTLWGNKNLMRDYIHPNDEGYKILGASLIKAVKSAPLKVKSKL